MKDWNTLENYGIENYEDDVRRYRVEIVDSGTDKVVKVVGEHMSEERAEARLRMAVMRTDIGKFFVRIVDEDSGEVL